MQLILGIFLLLLLYLLSGYQKIINFNKSVKHLKTKFDEKFGTDFNINFYKFLMILTIILLTFGSILMLYLSYKNIKIEIIKILCLFFIIFTLLATYVVHWPAVGKEYYQFLKNLSMVGGFIILYNYYNK